MNKYDRQGRQFIALHDVRGAIVTASASLSSGTAASLIAGDSDYFLDIIELTCANNSNAATTVTLINDGTTIRTFGVPAFSTAQVQFDVPLGQNTKNTPWIVDLPDITGTTISIAARLIKATP